MFVGRPRRSLAGYLSACSGSTYPANRNQESPESCGKDVRTPRNSRSTSSDISASRAIGNAGNTAAWDSIDTWAQEPIAVFTPALIAAPEALQARSIILLFISAAQPQGEVSAHQTLIMPGLLTKTEESSTTTSLRLAGSDDAIYTIDELIKQRASTFGDSPLLCFPKEGLTDYEEHSARAIDRYVDAAADALQGRGLERAVGGERSIQRIHI